MLIVIAIKDIEEVTSTFLIFYPIYVIFEGEKLKYLLKLSVWNTDWQQISAAKLLKHVKKFVVENCLELSKTQAGPIA